MRGHCLTAAQVARNAFENEVEASTWAIRSMGEHVRLLEESLNDEQTARFAAEQRAARLERDLRAAGVTPSPPASGVRLRGQPA